MINCVCIGAALSANCVTDKVLQGLGLLMDGTASCRMHRCCRLALNNLFEFLLINEIAVDVIAWMCPNRDRHHLCTCADWVYYSTPNWVLPNPKMYHPPNRTCPTTSTSKWVLSNPKMGSIHSPNDSCPNTSTSKWSLPKPQNGSYPTSKWNLPNHKYLKMGLYQS